MKILLTNDDGYLADGINSMFDILSEKHDVWMIAPSEERSACSNAITMRSTLDITNIKKNVFSLSGFPADCINVALHTEVIPKVDLVISGINHGPNMGDDVYYSGTVAGARSAFINGVSGIAVSLSGNLSRPRFDECSRFIGQFIDIEKDLIMQHRMLLNINYPAHEAVNLSGVALTSLDKRRYIDRYEIYQKTDSVQTIKLEGTVESERKKGSDFDAVSSGFISVTPLTLDTTDYLMIDKISKTSSKLMSAALEWLEI